MKANCSESRTKLDRGTFVPSAALNQNPLLALSLADLRAFLLPLRGVSIIKAPQGETRPSSTFSFVRGHRLCRDEGRGGHLKSPPLIHHTHMQCTYRMSKRERVPKKGSKPSPIPSLWDVKPTHQTPLSLHWFMPRTFALGGNKGHITLVISLFWTIGWSGVSQVMDSVNECRQGRVYTMFFKKKTGNRAQRDVMGLENSPWSSETSRSRDWGGVTLGLHQTPWD